MKEDLRLKKPADFKKVFKEGRKFLSPHFALYMLKKDPPRARLGISISKSHFKLATSRNKLKRVAKEAFRNTLLPPLRRYDLVIASRSGKPAKHFKDITEELKTLVSQIKLYRNGE